MYLKQISAMMHTFGDVKQPDKESVKVMQTILRDQMNVLLSEAGNIAAMRKGSEINHGDLLFLMRKSKMKLKRLIDYLKVSDWKQGLNYSLSLNEVYIDDEKLKGKLVKKCMDFLKYIEDCDEFTSFIQDETVTDNSAKKRKMRRYWMTNAMTPKEYEEFAEASRATFYPFIKFKRWLLKDKVVCLDLTDDAVRMINFLARETIAEIVDLVLIMKIKLLGKQQHLWYDCAANSLLMDQNLETGDTSELTNKNDDNEGDYSTNTAPNDVCSVHDEDSGDELIVIYREDFNYVSHEEGTEKNIVSSEMNENSTKLNSEQSDLPTNISSARSQLGEDSLQEDESVCQKMNERFNSSSESFDGSCSDTSECYEEASNEAESNSVPGDFSKSPEEIFSYDPQSKINVITKVSAEPELFNMSHTDALYSENDSLPNISSNLSKPSFCEENKFQETPIAETSSQFQEEEGPIVDISDTSDHESISNDVMSNGDPKKSSKRKYSLGKRSKRRALEDSAKEKSAIANYASIAAKNEVKYASPIEPEEITEAYALLQKPSPMALFLSKGRLPRKTKLICLADSISLT